jgi:large subunit ribosomal protein L29
MASKKYLELQEFADEELVKELESAEADYQKMLFDHAVKGLDNPMKLRDLRKDIARLNTEIRHREMAKFTPEQQASRSKIRARRRLQ